MQIDIAWKPTLYFGFYSPVFICYSILFYFISCVFLINCFEIWKYIKLTPLQLSLFFSLALSIYMYCSSLLLKFMAFGFFLYVVTHTQHTHTRIFVCVCCICVYVYATLSICIMLLECILFQSWPLGTG